MTTVGRVVLYGDSLVLAGVGHAYSSSTVKNSVFWGNTSYHGAQLYAESGGILNVSYSDIQGGYAGEGNIAESPSTSPSSTAISEIVSFPFSRSLSTSRPSTSRPKASSLTRRICASSSDFSGRIVISTTPPIECQLVSNRP